MIQLALILMGLFAAIGVYWAVRAESFLEWTTAVNLKFRKNLNPGFSHPVLVERSYASYYRLETDGIMGTFAWSLRFLGIVLAFFAIFVSSFIISSFV
jgi:hypothetical protein